MHEYVYFPFTQSVKWTKRFNVSNIRLQGKLRNLGHRENIFKKEKQISEHQSHIHTRI